MPMLRANSHSGAPRFYDFRAKNGIAEARNLPLPALSMVRPTACH